MSMLEVTGYPKVTKRLDSLGGEKGVSFLVFGGVVVVVEEDVVAEVGAFAVVCRWGLWR